MGWSIQSADFGIICFTYCPLRMRKDRIRAHCARCRHQQLFIRARLNHLLHLMLTIMTVGLWLISWLALCIGQILRPWRCEHCGWHHPEFKHDKTSRKPSRSPSPRPGIHAGPLLTPETSRLRP
jgi:hypothetical protein